MQGLITLDYTWVKSAYETYEKFKKISSPSSELRLKAEILLLNCLLTMNYNPLPYIANEIDPKKIEAHMTNIFCSFRSSITFDTSILYFIIRIKYLCLYEDGSSYAQCKEDIVTEIDSFIELVNSDWSVNNKYKKEALQLLNRVRQLLLDC